jgi:hypothetical protein
MSRRRRRERAIMPSPSAAIDRARAMSRFARLNGRGVVLGFVPYGPLVAADTPAELADAVATAIAADTGQQRPS